jgi:hypothetical protein
MYNNFMGWQKNTNNPQQAKESVIVSQQTRNNGTGRIVFEGGVPPLLLMR